MNIFKKDQVYNMLFVKMWRDVVAYHVHDALQLMSLIKPRREVFVGNLADNRDHRFRVRTKKVTFLLTGPDEQVKKWLKSWLEALKDNNKDLNMRKDVLIIVGITDNQAVGFTEAKWKDFQSELSREFAGQRIVYIDTYKNAFTWWPVVLREIYPATLLGPKTVMLQKIDLNNHTETDVLFEKIQMFLQNCGMETVDNASLAILVTGETELGTDSEHYIALRLRKINENETYTFLSNFKRERPYVYEISSHVYESRQQMEGIVKVMGVLNVLVIQLRDSERPASPNLEVKIKHSFRGFQITLDQNNMMSDGTYKLLGKSRQGSWSEMDTLTCDNSVITLSDSEKSSVRVMYEDGKGMTFFGKPAKVRAPLTCCHVFVFMLYMFITIPSLALSIGLFPVATCVYNLIRCPRKRRDSFVPAVIYSTVTFVLSGLGGLGYCTYYFYKRDIDDIGDSRNIYYHEFDIGMFWGVGLIGYIPVFIGYGFACYSITKYIYKNANIVKWTWLPPPLNLIFNVCQRVCDCLF